MSNNLAISMARIPQEILESKAHQNYLAELDRLKPRAKNWSPARRNAFAFEAAKFVRDAKTAHLSGRLRGQHAITGMLTEAARVSPDAAMRKLALEANTTADFQILSSQILVTFADLWERFHIADLVSLYSLNAPRGYIEKQVLRYADAATGYEAGDPIAPNVDPDYADSPGECQVANAVKLTNSLTPLDAITKRLTADWSIKAEQDSAAMFQINLPARLRQGMVDVITRAWQQEILLAMIAGAGQAVTWQEAPQGAYVNFLPNHWNNTLYSVALVALDTDMRQDAEVRRGANVVAGNSVEIARFARLREYRMDAPAGSFPNLPQGTGNDQLLTADANVDTAFRAAGKLFTEFEYMPANRLLVVSKDDSRPAMIHAPLSYAAETDLGTLTHPSTGCREIGIMSRAANHLALPNAIGLVTIVPAT